MDYPSATPGLSREKTPRAALQGKKHRAGSWLQNAIRRIGVPDLGLVTRIVLATGVSGVITIAALTIFMYRGSEEILVQRDTERLARSLEASVSRSASAIEFYRQDTLLLAKTPPIQGLFRSRTSGVDPLDGSTSQMWRTRLATIFAGMLEARPEYVQVRYIGLRDYGREVVRVDRLHDGSIRRVPEADLQSKGDMNYLAEAVRLGSGDTYVSDIELNKEHGEIETPHRPVLRVGTPVISEDGDRLGAIIINVDMDRMMTEVEESLPDPVDIYITNQDGDFLDHPQAAKTFGFELGHRYRMQDEFPALASLYEGDRESLSGMVDSPSGKVLAIASRVHFDPQQPSRYLVIAEMLPADELAANLWEMRNWAIFLAGAFLFAGLLITIILVRRIARPLSELSTMADNVANGSRWVEIGEIGMRRDEVGVLARSFDAMVREVEARAHDLAAETEKLARANESLTSTVRSNEELARFAYVASHDLQEPLRMVDSYMGLLERRYKGRLDSDADEFIGYAVDGARRMKLLINDLLDYSRVSNRPLKIAPVDLNLAVDSVLTLLRDRLEESGGEILMDPLPTVPADAGLIERLLTNLIGNAIKFRGESNPKIRIGAKLRGDFWDVTVADNGIGIAPEFRERVFEIFSRLHGRDKYDGTGIGLAACKRIVELHGGSIWAENGPDGGSVFHFTLPKGQD